MHRHVDRGKALQYLVFGKHYDLYKDSWESEANLASALERVTEH